MFFSGADVGRGDGDDGDEGEADSHGDPGPGRGVLWCGVCGCGRWREDKEPKGGVEGHGACVSEAAGGVAGVNGGGDMEVPYGVIRGGEEGIRTEGKDVVAVSWTWGECGVVVAVHVGRGACAAARWHVPPTRGGSKARGILWGTVLEECEPLIIRGGVAGVVSCGCGAEN